MPVAVAQQVLFEYSSALTRALVFLRVSIQAVSLMGCFVGVGARYLIEKSAVTVQSGSFFMVFFH